MNVTVNSAANPRWANDAQTAVLLECTFEHLGNEVVPFAAVNGDCEQHGQDLFDRAMAGEFGPIAAYTAPARNIHAEIRALELAELLPRAARDSLLAIAEKEAASVGVTPAQLEALNPGYRKVKALHKQIADLRALL
jgi:hypothetical protein